ncbi:MAG: ABC transporter permease [Pseudobutyrivibrio sp.]|nr:ABC transporter permease [Pseudobutyrivibrio sp.]
MIKYWLLFKRLIKKKSYLAMILVVPLMVLAMTLVARGQAGFMTIGLYFEEAVVSDAAPFLQEDLRENPGSFTFVFYDDKEQLEADLRDSTLTEAWIIPEDFDSTIADMARYNDTDNPVRILVREEGISHLLAREFLSARLYPLIAKEVMGAYAMENFRDLSDTDLNQLNNIFDTYELEGNLFEMGYLDGDRADDSDGGYLLMPLRGILSLWLLLCGFAGAMYYIKDREDGLFIWWKSKTPFLRDMGYFLVIVIVPSLLVLFGLLAGGAFTTVSRELSLILLYDLTIILIGDILVSVLRKIKNIGLVMPLAILSSALLSPVFIDLKSARQIQVFFPTFLYMSGIHDDYYVGRLAMYILYLLFIDLIIRGGESLLGLKTKS